MLPESLKISIEEKARQNIDKDFNIQRSSSVSGGCINNGRKLETTSGNYFIKYNSPEFERMFEVEFNALEILYRSCEIESPKPYFFGSSENGQYDYLLMEWIEQGTKNESFWRDFGYKLAGMHQLSREEFGLDHDNYMGALKQSNSPHKSFSIFFEQERLRPQIKLARKNNLMPPQVESALENFIKEMPGIFPEEKPSLIHGDLWGGNLIASKSNKAVLIDPALHYGHRECDIAMTQLFGGFDNSYLSYYQEVFPLENGFKDRLDYCNIYPLLIHVNLFGESYLWQIQQILKKFS